MFIKYFNDFKFLISKIYIKFIDISKVGMNLSQPFILCMQINIEKENIDLIRKKFKIFYNHISK